MNAKVVPILKGIEVCGPNEAPPDVPLENLGDRACKGAARALAWTIRHTLLLFCMGVRPAVLWLSDKLAKVLLFALVVLTVMFCMGHQPHKSALFMLVTGVGFVVVSLVPVILDRFILALRGR